VKARATIIGLDGRVLADSSLSGPELAAVENHGHRPEVREALRGDSGSAIRHSATVDVDLLYAAVPIRHEGRTIGVARVADPLQARLTELAGERKRTETILSAIDGGLLAVDHRGTVILANESLRRSLDLPDPLGRHYVEVIRHPEVGRALEGVLRTGHGHS